jgi:SapC
MVKIVPVDRERHAGKGWLRPQGYDFAAADVLAPLGGSEFAQAVLAMPIGFVEKSGHYVPVALLGLAKGTNVFIGPGNQWLGGYVPAVFRTYPFSLMRREGSEETILCVDEESGLVVDEGKEKVEKFFEADGSPSAMTHTLANVLRRIEQDQTVADLAVAALAEAGVIKPWPLTAAVGDQQVTVNGLHQTDELALNALDDATFIKLRKASSLVIAHGQLLSMAQVSVLSRLSALQRQLEQPAQLGAQ